MPHGYGQEVFKNGSQYVGEYYEDKRSGIGKFVTPRHYFFLGNWVLGVRHGKGLIGRYTSKSRTAMLPGAIVSCRDGEWVKIERFSAGNSEHLKFFKDMLLLFDTASKRASYARRLVANSVRRQHMRNRLTVVGSQRISKKDFLQSFIVNDADRLSSGLSSNDMRTAANQGKPGKPQTWQFASVWQARNKLKQTVERLRHDKDETKEAATAMGRTTEAYKDNPEILQRDSKSRTWPELLKRGNKSRTWQFAAVWQAKNKLKGQVGRRRQIEEETEGERTSVQSVRGAMGAHQDTPKLLRRLTIGAAHLYDPKTAIFNTNVNFMY